MDKKAEKTLPPGIAPGGREGTNKSYNGRKKTLKKTTNRCAPWERRNKGLFYLFKYE
jgi:hypothetical protein